MSYSDLPNNIPFHVAQKFEFLTFEAIKRGVKKYSADAVLHRIRWFYHVERGDHEFKCNNNWTSALSRWFMDRHPEYLGFFETRVIKRKETADEHA